MIHGIGTSWVKIGQTSNIHRRFQQIQKGVPFQVRLLFVEWVEDVDQRETALKVQYAESWVRGEWFAPSQEELMALLEAYPDTTQEAIAYDDVARIVASLSRMFRVSEIARMLHMPPEEGFTALRKICNSMVHKGILERVSHGVYRKVPSRLYVVS